MLGSIYELFTTQNMNYEFMKYEIWIYELFTTQNIN